MAATVCRCDGCGREFVAARRHARWHSDACRIAYARKRSSTPRDDLLADSASMGIVERVNGVWQLTLKAEREFGAALRALPTEIRDEVRTAA